MYRSLKPSEQVGAMMAGTLTGLIGVLFAQCEPDVHNDLMKAIKSYLPQARVQAEGIIAADSSSVKNSEG